MPQLAVLPLPEAVKRRKGSEFADSALAAWHGICARLADLQAVLKRMRSSDGARSPQSEHTPTDPSTLEKHGNGLKKAVVDFATKLEPQAHKHSPEQSQVLLRCRSLDHVSLEGLEEVLKGARKACASTAAKVDSEINKSVQLWIESDEKRGLGQVHAWAKNKVDPCVTEYASEQGLITRPLEVV